MHYLHIAQSDKPVAFYDLDVAISVGYRVKSKRGVGFRRWATEVLRQYVITGYAENKAACTIGSNRAGDGTYPESLESTDILAVVKAYTNALTLLDDYDYQRILKPKGRKTIYIIIMKNAEN